MLPATFSDVQSQNMGTYVPTLLPMNFCLPRLLPRPPCFSESLYHSESSSFIVSPSCFHNHQNVRMHHPRHLKNKTKFSLTFSSSCYICSSSVKIGIGAIISAIFQPRNYRSFDSFFLPVLALTAAFTKAPCNNHLNFRTLVTLRDMTEIRIQRNYPRTTFM